MHFLKLTLGEEEYQISDPVIQDKLMRHFCMLPHIHFLEEYYTLITGVPFFKEDFPCNPYGDLLIPFEMYQVKEERVERYRYRFIYKPGSKEPVSCTML